MSYQASKKVTLIGAAVNLFLSIIKLLAGSFGQSPALLADGIHSLSDLFSDALVLLASRFSHLDADVNHPYGHRRIETLATVVLGVFLILVGCGIAYEAIISIAHNTATKPDYYTIVIAIISVLANEILFRYTARVGKKINSPLIIANAWHHRSDALSSFVVCCGIAGALLGYIFLDAIAAIIVAIFIIKMGASFAWKAVVELSDEGLDPATLKPIEAAILATPGVVAMHQLRTRKMAERVYLDVHVQIDPYCTVSEGHFISESVHYGLRAKFKNIADVTVHVDVDEHDASLQQKYLPNRQKLVTELLPELQKLVPELTCDKVRMHYLADKLSLELILPFKYAEKSGSLQSKLTALAKTWNGVVAEVKLLFAK